MQSVSSFYSSVIFFGFYAYMNDYSGGERLNIKKSWFRMQKCLSVGLTIVKNFQDSSLLIPTSDILVYKFWVPVHGEMLFRHTLRWGDTG